MAQTATLSFPVLVYLCMSSFAFAQDDCKIPSEPKFKGFISRERRNYPTEDVEKAMTVYPEIGDAIRAELETRRDDKDPQAGNAYLDSDWKIHCPIKLKNLQNFGIKIQKQMCWVITPLWTSTCRQKTCSYTFVSQAYYLCRPRYMPVQFWAYCPTLDEGPFVLLFRYVPKYCDCRRYFCGVEGNPRLEPSEE